MNALRVTAVLNTVTYQETPVLWVLLGDKLIFFHFEHIKFDALLAQSNLSINSGEISNHLNKSGRFSIRVIKFNGQTMAVAS